jgi:hypothetical protein
VDIFLAQAVEIQRGEEQSFVAFVTGFETEKSDVPDFFVFGVLYADPCHVVRIIRGEPDFFPRRDLDDAFGPVVFDYFCFHERPILSDKFGIQGVGRRKMIFSG